MKIAFCTTCKGRAQHIKETLPRNLADNADHPDTVFVLVDYGSEDDLQAYIEEHHWRDIQRGRLVVYSRPNDGPFRMAHAKNLAHRLALLEGAEALCNLDADNYTGKGFATYIEQRFDHNPQSFLWAKMVKGEMARGISGRIVVTRAAFLTAGGYDEKYADWGPDDKDFNVRLRRLGYVADEIPRCFLDSVRHNNRMRFREYPHAADIPYDPNDGLELDSSNDTIANYGRVGCDRVWKNYDRHAITRTRAIPTRVFGIGMHKTGTTSLHHAFERLGLPSAHWPSAHWAKAVWSEMVARGRSTTLERSYASSDLPLTVLYRELDRAYTGSKFVLTLRSEAHWLESVRRHFDPATNPYQKQWDTDPFTNRIHRELYGRRRFDADVMLERYRRHNREVMLYFRNRPEDLLILDTDRPGRWAALGEFLHLPTPPRGTYPKANESTS